MSYINRDVLELIQDVAVLSFPQKGRLRSPSIKVELNHQAVNEYTGTSMVRPCDGDNRQFRVTDV